MKKILLSIVTIFTAFVLPMSPVYADCVETSILGSTKCRKNNSELIEDSSGSINCSCDDGNGSSIVHILKLVVDIMTIGIGILGVIGISISGIQYLTAGGSEEKTRKAKRRIFEIVIGLLVYVLIYTLLSWLLPSLGS